MQSPRKDRKEFDVEKEIVDVILASLSLAIHLHIDFEKVLKDRLLVINDRFKIK